MPPSFIPLSLLPEMLSTSVGDAAVAGGGSMPIVQCALGEATPPQVGFRRPMRTASAWSEPATACAVKTR